MENENNKIIIYTDGACKGNPGPGGFGVVMLWQDKRKELSAGFRYTTNNRMEIMAVIEALNKLNPAKKWDVTVRTDSAHVHDTISKGWIEGWKKRGWRKSDKKPVLNRDLWEKLDILLKKFDVKMEKVPAHAGVKENERCDQLAVEAAESEAVLTDIEYENTLAEKEDLFKEQNPELPEEPFQFDLVEKKDGKELLISSLHPYGLDKITIKAGQIREFINKLNKFLEQNGL